MQLGGAAGLIIVTEQMVEGERSVKESQKEENCVDHRFSWLQPLDLDTSLNLSLSASAQRLLLHLPVTTLRKGKGNRMVVRDRRPGLLLVVPISSLITRWGSAPL